MAGAMHRRFGLIRSALARCGLACVLAAGFSAAWAATHYPPGAVCYDCHAISKSKMVAGTHLLKRSPKTATLTAAGWVPGTPAPCLFCHERAAVSLEGRSTMRGVWDHFDGTSASKHRAAVASNFTADGNTLDCRDCHTGISLGVVSDLSGNAQIHGVDASGTTRVNRYTTLIGTPNSAAQVSANTCRHTDCHGGAVPNSYGTYAARPAHGMGTTTLAGGVTPTACTQCHGTHNSYRSSSILTLRINGQASNDLSLSTAWVTPSMCGVCHVQDDGSGGGAYALKGHGQSTIVSGSLGCTACHAETVPHGFSKDALGTNPLRFKFAENTSAQSSIRQEPPYNQAYSICLTCHAQFAGKLHGGTSAKAGCNDCHEPHGAGVTPNVAMVRVQIPKVDAAGNPVYGDGSALAPYETNSYLEHRDATYKTDGTALCDNRECHQGRTTTNDHLLYPLGTGAAPFLQGDRHSGGNIAINADFDCQTCHKHLDDKGSWGAAASCTTCHGQPPVSTATTSEGYTTFSEARSPHRRHASPVADGGYGYRCQTCHLDYTSGATHNTTTKTYQSLNFDAARNPSPAPNLPSYTADTATCNNLYCHSDGQRSTSVGSVQWMSGFDTPNWSTQNLGCNACHGTTTSPNTLTYGAPDHPNGTGGHTPNSHTRHAGYACRVCHFDTIADGNPTDGWTLPSPPSSHVNNSKNLRADGTAATFTSTGTTPATCNTISCHNGGNAVWGATLGCSDCHFRTAAQGGDLDNFVYGDGVLSAVNSDEWTATGHGRTTAYPSGNSAANFSGPAADPRGCAYCHSFLGSANNPLVAHGVGTNPFRLANQGVLSGTGNEHRGWNDACLVCHGTGSTGYDPDGGGGVYTGKNGTRNVGENHYGGKHGAGRNGGAFCWDCHDPHGDDQHYMVQGGAGVTSHSDGLYGIPVTRRPVTGLNVASGGYTSSDLVNDNFSGLCQTCHTVAASYNQSTNTPLADHNGAHTQRCTACHTHDNDFGAGCTSCHGFPPPESPFAGTTVTWNSDKAATPATLGAHNTHAAGATPYAIGSCFLTCHTGDTHLTNKTAADMGVKAATVGASTGIYQYSTLDSFDVWLGGALPGNQSVVDDTCTNVVCHASTYDANAFRSPANPGYRRYWNQNLDCYSCHAYDGVTATFWQSGSTSFPTARPEADRTAMASGSHAVHVETYRLSCHDCHIDAGGGQCSACHVTIPENTRLGRGGSHKNGTVNFVSNFGVVRLTGDPRGGSTGGFYDADGSPPFSTVANLVPRENGGTGYYCVNVYCHSTGEPRGPEAIAYRNGTRWTQAATGACGTCHAVDAVAGSLTTNVHEKHVGSVAGQYGYACTVCHATVVGGAKPAYTIASTALHVNGTNNVAFAANEGTYATTGGTVAPDGGTCSATYCHSQGLDRSAPYTGTATAPVTTADWDTVQGTAGCGYCHGNPPAYSNNTTIRPNATNLTKKNSHDKHASYTCDRCHYTTTQNGTTIASVANHANKAWDVAANTGAGVTFTVAVQGTLSDAAYTPTTCNTISCHGGGNAVWGATLTCADCHFAASDRDNWNIADGTAALVSSTEWAAAGHGRTSSYPSGNPAGNFAGLAADPQGCAYCHSFLGTANNPLVAHGVGINPFRLANKSGTAEDNGWNNVCLVCHRTGDTGYDPDGGAGGYQSRNGARNVDENHYGTKHNVASKGGTFCWDCHDPHGDVDHYMIHSGDGAAPGRGVTDVSDGLYGIPVSSRPVTGFNVETGGYTSADLANVANTGLCQTCHAASGGALYYNRNTFTALASHNGADATRCTQCHPHSDGFWASCSGCHGSAATGQFWPSGSGGAPAWVNDEPGAHDAHVRAIGRYLGYGDFSATMYDAVQQTAICAFCHPDPGSSGHEAGDGNQRVDLYGATGPGDRFRSWRPGAGASGEDASPAATYDPAARTCANSGCHYRTPTPSYGGAGWNGAGQGANQATCLTCHFFRDTGTYASPAWTPGALPNSHPVHVAGIAPPSNSQSKAYPCATCHPTAGYTNAHADGSIGLGTAGLPNPTGTETFGGFNAQLKYGAGAAATQCSNFYCHGAAFPADVRGTNTAPVWNDHSTAYCSTCHNVDVNGGLGNAVTRGKHTTHLSPIGTGPRWGPGMGSHSADCTYCHGIRSHTGGTPGCYAQLCHPGGGNDRPGGITDRGWASFPTASHVDGAFRVDFQGRDRGWNWFDDYVGGSTAGTVTTLADTDVCDRCHSTAEVAGSRGAQFAKDNWLTPGYRLPCASCHNAASPAYSTAVNAGVAAPEKTSRYTADNGGHGRAGTFSATSNPAPGYTQCTECHSNQGLHITGFAGDGTRLAGGLTRLNICSDCHVPGRTTLGVLGRDATVEASFHASSVTGNYGTNAAYNYACVACHDPHGTSNIAMIKTTIADGMGAQATGVTLSAETGLDPSSAPDNGVCDRCHADGAQAHALTSFPNNHNYGTRCLDCHDHKASFSSSCEGCHGGGDPAAPQVVWPGADRPSASGQAGYGSHLKANRSQTLGGTTNWKLQCNQCHTGHNGPVQVPSPPTSWNNRAGGGGTTFNMQSRLGLDYALEPGVAIHLGGTATPGVTTEAEFCWGCHDSQNPQVSEWGYNTKTTPSGFPVVQIPTADDGTAETFNFGWIYTSDAYTTKTSNWTTGYWRDQYDPALRRRIVSVHAVNLNQPVSSQFSSAEKRVNVTTGAITWTQTPGTNVETVAQIRCSYCHDVHDLNRSQEERPSAQGGNNRPQTGKPWLRGKWMGNPYPPDLPPRPGYTYPLTGGPTKNKFQNQGATFQSTAQTAGMPRLWGHNGDNVSRGKGGFFIDQNSNNPTSQTGYTTLEDTAGLCTLCHGTDVNNMDYYPNSTAATNLWRSIQVNGHSNAILGGTGANKRKIFDARRGGTNASMGQQMPASKVQPELGTFWGPRYMSTKVMQGSVRWGPFPTGWWGTPAGGDHPAFNSWSSMTGWSDWYGIAQVAKTNYHRFTCSKCHTPHASGLPALLTTNCLDVNVVGTKWSAYGSGTTGVTPLGNAANNCHRKTAASDGWHRLGAGPNE